MSAETMQFYQPDPVTIPALPVDAPHEQMMDFAAVCGAMVAHIGMSDHDQLRRIARSYLNRWHPEPASVPPDGRAPLDTSEEA